jgi:hypothetical protein
MRSNNNILFKMNIKKLPFEEVIICTRIPVLPQVVVVVVDVFFLQTKKIN